MALGGPENLHYVRPSCSPFSEGMEEKHYLTETTLLFFTLIYSYACIKFNEHGVNHQRQIVCSPSRRSLLVEGLLRGHHSENGGRN